MRPARFLLVLVLAGCAAGPSVAPPPAPPPPAAAPACPAADPRVGAVHWVRGSAEYRAATLQAFAWATRLLEEMVAGRAPGTWAVSLDGDETVIDNSLYQKERGAAGYSRDSFGEWVERRAAPAVPGAIPFLERVHALGGKIAIVTGRDQPLCAATEDDFRRHGIPFDVMLCRPDPKLGEKEPRWDALRAGTAAPGLPPLEVVMWVGDNIKDFPDLDQSLRDAPDAAYANFGTRYVLIPNPMYGSWEENPPR